MDIIGGNYWKRLSAFLFILFAILILTGCPASPEVEELPEPKMAVTLAAPASVSVPKLAASASNVTVSWEPVEDATMYYLYYIDGQGYATGGEPSSTTVVGDVTKTFQSDLKAGERYVFWVVAARKMDDGSVILSESSDYAESAVEPFFSVDSIVDGDRIIMTFQTSVRDSLLRPGQSIYEPTFTIRYSIDGVEQEPKELVVTGSDGKKKGVYYWESDGDICPIELESSKEYSFAVDMMIPDAVLAPVSNAGGGESGDDAGESGGSIAFRTADKGGFKTDVSYYPAAVKEVTATRGMNGKIDISWVAPALNNQLSETWVLPEEADNKKITRCFDVNRYECESDGSISEAAKAAPVKILSSVSTGDKPKAADFDGKVTVTDNGADGAVYVFTDTKAEAGKDYKYEVVSCYGFDEKNSETGDITTFYYREKGYEACKTDSTRMTADSAWVLDEVQSIELEYAQNEGKRTSSEKVDDKNIHPAKSDPVSGGAKYTIRLKIGITNSGHFQYYKDNGATFAIVRDSEKNPAYTNSSLECDLSAASAFPVEFVDEIVVSDADNNKQEQKWSYSVKLVCNGESSKAADSDGVYSDPVFEPIVMCSNFTASETKDNAGKITLSWNTADQNVLAGRDVNGHSPLSRDKIRYELSRSVNGGSYELVTTIQGDVSKDTLTYTDTSVAAGTEYKYMLTSIYVETEEGHPYKDCDSGKTDPLAVTTLGSVKNLSATQGEFNDKVVVTWNAVTGAEQYKVQYKSADAASWTDAGTVNTNSYTFTEGAGTKEAGTKYQFRVYTLAANGTDMVNVDSTPMSDGLDKGFIFGIKGMKVTVDPNEDIDSITLKWNAVAGAAKYRVNAWYLSKAGDECGDNASNVLADGYTATAIALDTDATSANLSYEFKADKVADKGGPAWVYPLSRPYFFTVTPINGNRIEVQSDIVKAAVKENSSTETVASIKANWLMPPKNITASKSDYKDKVEVTWTATGATSYNVYRRIKGSNDDWGDPIGNPVSGKFDNWTTDEGDFAVKSGKEYEYTVAAVRNGKEGLKQTFFEDDTNNDVKKNVGMILSMPALAAGSSSISSSGYIDIKPVIGATYYVLEAVGRDSYVKVLSTEETGANRAGKYNGNIRFYLQDHNPKGLKIFACKKKDGSDDIVSDVNYVIKLTHEDVVNLSNAALKKVLKTIDEEFDGDWWCTDVSGVELNTEKIKAKPNRGVTQATDPGYVRIDDYSTGSVTIKTIENILFLSTDEGIWGYLTNGPLDLIGNNSGGKLKVTFPGSFTENCSVAYNKVKINGQSGTYNVAIDGNAKSIDAEDVPSLEFDSAFAEISYNPPVVLSVEASRGKKNGVVVKWTAPAISSELEQDFKREGADNTIERRFEVYRYEYKNGSVDEDSRNPVLFKDNTPIVPIVNGNNYSITDSTAEKGKDYKYEVISYYLFTYKEGTKTETFNNPEGGYAFAENSNRMSNTAWVLDDISSVSVSLKTSGKVIDGDNVKYPVSISVDVHHYDELYKNHVQFTIKRKDSNATDPVADATLTSSENTCDDVIVMTKSQDKVEHTFEYEVTFEYNHGTGTEVSQSGKAELKSIPYSYYDEKLFDNFKVSQQSHNGGRITISWDCPDGFDNKDVGSGYNKLSKSYLTYKLYRSDKTEPVATGVANAVSGSSYVFVDKAVADGTEYTYTLKAVYQDSSDSAHPNNGTQESTSEKGRTISAVSAITEVSDGTYTDKIVVKWSAAEGAQKYFVQYAKSDEGWNPANVVSVNSLSYDVPSTLVNATAGTPYRFRVYAADDEGNRVKTPSPEKVGSLFSVGKLTLTVTPDVNQITVSWDAVPGVSEYFVTVYKSNSYSDADMVGTKHASVSTNSFVFDTDDVKGATFEYPYSTVYHFHVTTDKNMSGAKASGHWLMPPRNIKATKSAYKDKIKVSWDKVDDASGYNVYRKAKGANDSTYAKMNASPVTSLSYDDSSVSSGMYEYTVSSVSSAGEGVTQNYFANDSTLATYKSNVGFVLLPPKNIKATKGASADADKITVSWDKVDGASNYVIYRKAIGETDYSEIATVGDVQSYDDSDSALGPYVYEYNVASKHSAGGISDKQNAFASDGTYSNYKTNAGQQKVDDLYDVNVDTFSSDGVISFGDIIGANYKVVTKNSASPSGEEHLSSDATVFATDYAKAECKFTIPADPADSKDPKDYRDALVYVYLNDTEKKKYNKLTHAEVVNWSNKVMQGPIKSANDMFGSDWWRSSKSEYTETGVSIKAVPTGETNYCDAYDRDGDNAGIQFTNYSKDGIIINTTNTKKRIDYWIGGKIGSYTSSNHPLLTIGYDGVGTNTVTLPDGFGNVEIVYNDVHVSSNNDLEYKLNLGYSARRVKNYGEVSKRGYYKVKFDGETEATEVRPSQVKTLIQSW